MTLSVTAALLLLVFAGDGRAADVHKCVTGGRTTYQSMPCEVPTNAPQSQQRRASALVGCYVANISGLENGFEVKRTDGADYKLEVTNGKDRTAIPLKAATPQEVQEVGAGFHLNLLEGLSVKWEAGTPNQKPVGLYRGGDQNGKEVYLAYFFFGNGLATRTQCK